MAMNLSCFQKGMVVKMNDCKTFFSKIRRSTAPLCAAVTAAGLLLSFPSQAASSALDAFNALTASDASSSEEIAHSKGAALDLLQSFLKDFSDGQGTLFPHAASLYVPDTAQALSLLCSLTDTDLTGFASLYELPPAYVRNTYYKALACVLQQFLTENPDADPKYQDLESILSLFLISDASDSADMQSRSVMQTIRSGMTTSCSAQIADAFDLPPTFVEYIIMEEDWHDQDWKKASDWSVLRAQLIAQESTQEASFGGGSEAANSAPLFSDQLIGSRDSGGSDTIRSMQEALIRLGYLRGNADGIFGPRTQAALIEYQLANGLHPSGVYRYTDFVSLQSPEAVPRTAYEDDFWDEDSFTPAESFIDPDYLADLYADADAHDDDRFEVDDDDDDDHFEARDDDDDDRFEARDDDDDDRFEAGDDDDGDRFEARDYDDGDRFEAGDYDDESDDDDDD